MDGVVCHDAAATAARESRLHLRGYLRWIGRIATIISLPFPYYATNARTSCSCSYSHVRGPVRDYLWPDYLVTLVGLPYRIRLLYRCRNVCSCNLIGRLSDCISTSGLHARLQPCLASSQYVLRTVPNQ